MKNLFIFTAVMIGTSVSYAENLNCTIKRTRAGQNTVVIETVSQKLSWQDRGVYGSHSYSVLKPKLSPSIKINVHLISNGRSNSFEIKAINYNGELLALNKSTHTFTEKALLVYLSEAGEFQFETLCEVK